MVHALLISALVVILVRDDMGPLRYGGTLSPWGAFGALLGVMAVVWAVSHLLIMRQGRILDRKGRIAAVFRSDHVLLGSRVVAAVIHAAGVLGLGTLDAVRDVTGDLVLVDELVTVLPIVVFLLLGWWSIYPIDRRVREAMMIRMLDEGRAVQPPVTRAAFVISAGRHQLALILVPVLLILAWHEGVDRIAHQLQWPPRRPPWGMNREAWVRLRGLVLPAVQFAGVIVVFVVAPLLLRHVWDTVRLASGALRDSLAEMCRAHRVKVRDLLVWRTGGTMINGAVMGIIGPARYILLTDALLESLTARQVEAVMAHEIGHVRRRHMIWLAVSVLGAILASALAAELGLRRVLGPGPPDAWMAPTLTGLSLGIALLAFGLASRRFEWQADAFAVKHLSGHRDGGPKSTITPESVDAMSEALQAVADLNHIPVERFSWRHGSIRSRQGRLRELVGRPSDRLAVDRTAAAVKIVSGLVLLGSLAAIVAIG